MIASIFSLRAHISGTRTKVHDVADFAEGRTVRLWGVHCAGVCPDVSRFDGPWKNEIYLSDLYGKNNNIVSAERFEATASSTTPTRRRR
jgi:hypothetical protein